MIPPLQKTTPDGAAYVRQPSIENLLSALYELPIEDVARRATINDANDADYVPSECVLHFVRQSQANGDTRPYQDLFSILRNRVLQAVPVRLQKLPGGLKSGERDGDGQVQDKVLFDFQKLLCLDRQKYEERLDYFECRFNAAIAALRLTARRQAVKEKERRVPMEYDGESNAPSPDIELALQRARASGDNSEEDFLFRSRLYQAISTLRHEERRTVELLLNGFPIDSKDPQVLTIAKVMGCTEKTVRNRRDRAFAALKAALKEENVP